MKRKLSLFLAAAMSFGVLSGSVWAFSPECEPELFTKQSDAALEDAAGEQPDASGGEKSSASAEESADVANEEASSVGAEESADVADGEKVSGRAEAMPEEAAEKSPEGTPSVDRPEDGLSPEAPDSSLAVQAERSGSLSSGALSWSLNSSGTLTIQGSGEMEDFVQNDKKAPWTEYAADVKAIVIQYGVTRVGNRAFANCENAASVSIPGSVKSIGDYAFLNCAALGSVSIPGSVERIGDFAFNNCNYLTNLTISNGVKTLGESSFARCAMGTVTLPASVEKLDNMTFFGCSNLNSISVDGGNQHYCAEEGVLFNKDKTELLRYPPAKSGETYAIPYGVKTVGLAAVSWSRYLKSVTIPNSVTSIEGFAFGSCDALTSVTLPESVTNLGYYLFLGPFAFNTELTAIYVEAGNPNYCSVSGVLFTKDQKELILYPANRSGKSYSVPAGTTDIAYRAFAGCQNLESVTFPKKLDVIDGFAFDDCAKLKTVTFKGGAPSYMASSSFYDLSLTVYYPDANTWTTEAKEELVSVKKIKWVKKYNAPETKVTSLTSPQKKWVKVAWKKASGISGYQMAVSETKTFKEGKHKVVSPSKSKKEATMSGFKSKKTYYIRVRTWKKEGSVIYYGKWSPIKSIKVK